MVCKLCSSRNSLQSGVAPCDQQDLSGTMAGGISIDLHSVSKAARYCKIISAVVESYVDKLHAVHRERLDWQPDQAHLRLSTQLTKHCCPRAAMQKACFELSPRQKRHLLSLIISPSEGLGSTALVRNDGSRTCTSSTMLAR